MQAFIQILGVVSVQPEPGLASSVSEQILNFVIELIGLLEPTGYWEKLQIFHF